MLNRIILIGRLVKDPEKKILDSDVAVANFTLAVNRPKYKKDEEPQTDFIPVTTWRSTADFAEKYFEKGKQVYISGRLETYSYEDQNGQRKYGFKVNADEIGFADSKKMEEKPHERPETVQSQGIGAENELPFQDDFPEEFCDDLPF